MKIISYWSVRLVAFIFSILPFGALYALSDFLYIVLYKLVGYRVKVVKDNLQKSFPEYNPDKILAIEKLFYKNLCDITLESFKAFSMSKATLLERYKVVNPEILDEHYERGESVFISASHFSNWEWGTLIFNLALKHAPVGIYKPLTNPVVNKYVTLNRGRFGLILLPMKQALAKIAEMRDQPYAFIIVNDQWPSNLEQAHRVRFLQRNTPFLHGLDKIARETGHPVYYIHINRVRRGYYELTLSLLCIEPKTTKEGEVTTAFAAKLESLIYEKPQDWLWSHRRWKKVLD